MDVNNVNPFVESFACVMPQLGFTEVRKGNLSVHKQDLVFSGVIIIVGIVGAVKGNVVYCLEMESAKKIASTMMMGMPVDELDEMSQSALSELTNMLTASAATLFSNRGVLIDISTPTMLQGEEVSVKMSAKQVLRIQLFANEHPIDINIAFEDK